jgi:hypothetical protein
MSVLSPDIQKEVEETLVKDGYFTKDKLVDLKSKAEQEKVPLLSYLVSDGGVSQEVAHILSHQYYNFCLKNQPSNTWQCR